MKTPECVRRHPENPILSRQNVPYPANLVFNAGVARYQGKYVMVFRNDHGLERDEVESGKRSPAEFKTNIGLAFSSDGVHWSVEPKPCFSWSGEGVLRAYDPRLTVIEGKVVMCFALDTTHGIRGGIAVTEDFVHFEVKHLTTPDNRNMVLFPERIKGRYIRLERPFPVYSRGRDRFDIWMSGSPDLADWGSSKLILGVEDVPFANDKIGPGAPPIRTSKGWLTTFHGVDRDETRGKNGWEAKWAKRYTAGIMLLDLEDPSRILGIATKPLIVPEAPYEVSGGYRDHVVFPGGLILEPDGNVKIYYGAGDAVVCLAESHVDDLLGLCLNDTSSRVTNPFRVSELAP